MKESFLHSERYVKKLREGHGDMDARKEGRKACFGGMEGGENNMVWRHRGRGI